MTPGSSESHPTASAELRERRSAFRPGQTVQYVGKDSRHISPPALVVSTSDPEVPRHLLFARPDPSLLTTSSRNRNRTASAEEDFVIVKELPEHSFSWVRVDRIKPLSSAQIEARLRSREVCEVPQLLRGFQEASITVSRADSPVTATATATAAPPDHTAPPVSSEAPMTKMSATDAVWHGPIESSGDSTSDTTTNSAGPRADAGAPPKQSSTSSKKEVKGTFKKRSTKKFKDKRRLEDDSSVYPKSASLAAVDEKEAGASTAPSHKPVPAGLVKVDIPTAPLGQIFPLRLQFDDLSHDGVDAFQSKLFRGTSQRELLETAVKQVRAALYPAPGLQFQQDLKRLLGLHAMQNHALVEKSVRSITLIVRPTDGIAHTTGIRLDPAHKEIHLSAHYVKDQLEFSTALTMAIRESRQTSAGKKKATALPASNGPPHIPKSALVPVERELRGVITHELVHTLQHDGAGTAPGGLVEGIADWVRLRADLAPLHWNKYDVAKEWDAGYEKTAYFLNFAERYTKKPHLVPLLNVALAYFKWELEPEKEDEAEMRASGESEDGDAYDEDGEEKPKITLFEVITGYSVEHVWKEYRKRRRGAKGGISRGSTLKQEAVQARAKKAEDSAK